MMTTSKRSKGGCMSKQELDRCPFCGSDDIDVSDSDWSSYVICMGCGTESGAYDCLNDAIAAWNNRVNNEQD